MLPHSNPHIEQTLREVMQAIADLRVEFNRQFVHIETELHNLNHIVQGNGREGLTGIVTRIDERVIALRQDMSLLEQQIEELSRKTPKTLQNPGSVPHEAEVRVAIVGGIVTLMSLLIPILADRFDPPAPQRSPIVAPSPKK
jgi:hypothetical protein